MAVSKLFEGVQVIDNNGGRAFVTYEDAKEIAKIYGLDPTVDVTRVTLLAIVGAVTIFTILMLII